MRFDLHHGWQFTDGRTAEAYPARVPGCIHTDLLRNRLIPDPFWGGNELQLQWIEERDWTYAIEFDVPPALLQMPSVDLVAEGLDTLATVTLNGSEIARTQSMFIGYRWEVKRHLRAGSNRLEIRFDSPMPYIREKLKSHFRNEWNDPVGGCSTIRKQQCSFGWDWGPRFATCGIYKSIWLEGYSGTRLDFVQVEQVHSDGVVELKLKSDQPIKSKLLLDGQLVVEGGKSLLVKQPRLWWPNGLGDQPLYELVVENADGATWRRRIGLRDLQLRRRPDEFGESFEFVVNGRPLFAKGANWIPQHSFVTEHSRARYDDLLESARAAHMNMLRVWGGGIYEMDDFYDLCDEKGILIWQDFMFACAFYPADDAFSALVKQEIEHQVQRLQHHACLALWCGNNELEQRDKEFIDKPHLQAPYEKVFYGIIPEAVNRLDGTRTYWPSSPHNPEGYRKGFNNEKRGDAHFWNVWHARHPVKAYEQTKFRFVSEFGMQAYPHHEIARTFCDETEMNIFSPAMENHQKNAAGNQIIFDYVSKLYRFPKDYASVAYLSQLNQAYCIKTAVEHFRRSMPRTMGALYWQLNDCWPVASWSGLEFDGRWRALHFAAKRFFAPALISAHVPGDEKPGIGNYRSSTIHDVHLWTVYDAPNDATGQLHWSLHRLGDWSVLRQDQCMVDLCFGQARLRQSLDFAFEMERHGAHDLVLRVGLSIEGKIVSEDSVFLTAPRNLDLPATPIQVQAESFGATAKLILQSEFFHHRVEVNLRGTPFRADDNFVDLYPGEPRIIELRLAEPLTSSQLRDRIEIRSLVNSYS